MEVTKSTLDESIDEILDDIRNADFIAIDTNVEITGFINYHNESLNLWELNGYV